jgi:hypothetical protein
MYVSVLLLSRNNNEFTNRVSPFDGRAIAQAVSRRLPTAAAPFPLPIRIPPIAPLSPSSIIWGWHNRPNSGRSTKWTQSHPMRKIIKNNNTLVAMLAISRLEMFARLIGVCL